MHFDHKEPAGHEDVMEQEERTPLRIESFVIKIDGCYASIRSGTPAAISNFTLVLREKMTSENPQYKVLVIPQIGAQFSMTITAGEALSLSAFRKRLSREDFRLSFSGTQRDFEDVIRLWGDDKYANTTLVDSIGMHFGANGAPIFVTQDGAINRRGEPVRNLCLDPTKGEIKCGLVSAQPATNEEAEMLLAPLLSYNDRPITATVLGFIGACFLDGHFRKLGIKHGHLVITGEAGSGKSTTVESVIQPIFGLGTGLAASNITGFTLMRAASSSNTVPLIIEEFKAAQMTKANLDQVGNLLRSSYDGHIATRGRGDMGLNRYAITAPIILVGETSPFETAVRCQRRR
jgi:putative DNA primase/helicase